jgi:collagenase-like PrtC family protease
MKYSIPYTPGLLKILLANRETVGEQISDVYFSDNQIPSNRHFKWDDSNWDELNDIAEEFNCALHYVVNPSVYDNSIYLPDGFNKFIDILNNVWEKGARWLTFNNSIMLRIAELRDNIPPFLIKNSVNNKINTLEQVIFWHTQMHINDIILDRSINRNIDDLKHISEYAKEYGLTLTLLANEGCLPNCSWKQPCDNMISQYHKDTPKEVGDLRSLHGVLACTMHYERNPADTLKSPYILPNNIETYSPYADCIKIAGRMSDADTLWDILESYFLGSGNISLYKFFSTKVSELYNRITFTDLVELNFDQKTNNCKNQCASCNFCERVMDQLMFEKNGVKTNYADTRKVFKPRT